MFKADHKYISIIYQLYISIIFRTSRPAVFCKKGLLKKFAKCTGKHQCQSLYFNKFAGLRPATLLKKSLWQRCFPLNFVKFLRTPFFTEYLWLLLLYISFSYNESKFLLSCHIENRAVRYYVILIGNFVVRIKVARVVNIGFYELIFFIIW